MVPLPLADGYVSSAWLYQPQANTALPVVYVHGIQSHPGWFSGSCMALAEAGHGVLAATRRGSGDNNVRRGHARNWRQLVNDLSAAVALARREFSAPQVHLVGVSWGGKLAAALCLEEMQAGGPPAAAPSVASLTMVAPGIVPQVDVPLSTKLAVAGAMLCCRGKTFEIPLSEVELFTDNPAMQDYLRQDPARLHRATASFLFASRMLDRRLAAAAEGSLRVPTTLLLASRDRIIDNARTEQAVQRLCGGRARVVTLQAAHTMDFELDPRPFLDVLLANCHV